MSESPTVREIFEIPSPGSPEESAPRWQSFREWINNEVKDIKTVTTPDVVAKLGELLEISIPEILLTAWKKTNMLQQVLEDSRKTPESILSLELAEHTINSQHHPHIEIRVKNDLTKKIDFTLRLIFKLQGFGLKIQDGSVREVRSGKCDVRGTLEYQGLTIAEQKVAPINLPASFPVETIKKIWAPEPEVKPATSSESATPGLERAAELLKPEIQAAPTAQAPKSPEVIRAASGADTQSHKAPDFTPPQVQRAAAGVQTPPQKAPEPKPQIHLPPEFLAPVIERPSEVVKKEAERKPAEAIQRTPEFIKPKEESVAPPPVKPASAPETPPAQKAGVGAQVKAEPPVAEPARADTEDREQFVL
jgi:hypothetical protein